MPSPYIGTSIAALHGKPLLTDFDAYGLTHRGKVRKENEDHFIICSLRKQMQVHRTSLPDVKELALPDERLAYLAMVADGVGSGRGGEEASRHAISEVAQYAAQSLHTFYTADPSDEPKFLEAMHEAAMRCHASVVKKSEEDRGRRGMATTLTLWLGVWPRAYLLQVGDTRFYLFRGGELTQITRDQTMAQDLVDQGVLTSSDADNTKWAHVLSSAIGGMQNAPVVTRIDQAWHNVGLLCSDGLTKHVPEEQIAERLRTMKSAKQVCKTLLQDALDDGGSDNITIIVGRVVREDEP